MWRDRSACLKLDPNLFFPDADDPEAEVAPKAVCQGCPVKTQCLEFALENNEKFGIWGGLNEAERKKIRRTRRKVRPLEHK